MGRVVCTAVGRLSSGGRSVLRHGVGPLVVVCFIMVFLPLTVIIAVLYTAATVVVVPVTNSSH